MTSYNITKEELKRARQALGLSQQGMADALGVLIRHYQFLEAGDRPPTRAHALTVGLLLLGVKLPPIEQLLERIELEEM